MSDICGIYSNFQDIPSIFWQFASVSIGIGCFLSLSLILILIPACCFKNIATKSSSVLIGLFQVVSGRSYLIDLLVRFSPWRDPRMHFICDRLG